MEGEPPASPSIATWCAIVREKESHLARRAHVRRLLLLAGSLAVGSRHCWLPPRPQMLNRGTRLLAASTRVLVPIPSVASARINVNGYASFRDYDCTPSYACDRNVFASFTVHRGLSRYSPRVASWTDATGQYGTSMRHTFRVPRCGVIPRYQSVTYTVYMQAVAPNGQERSAQTYVYLRSCA